MAMDPSKQAQSHYFDARKELFAPDGGGDIQLGIFYMLCSIERRLVELIQAVDPEKKVDY